MYTTRASRVNTAWAMNVYKGKHRGDASMDNAGHDRPQTFRLWLASCAAESRPKHWNEVPARATALELIDNAVYGLVEAAQFLEGFNRLMAAGESPIWGVAVQVRVRYEGEPRP